MESLIPETEKKDEQCEHTVKLLEECLPFSPTRLQKNTFKDTSPLCVKCLKDQGTLSNQFLQCQVCFWGHLFDFFLTALFVAAEGE